MNKDVSREINAQKKVLRGFPRALTTKPLGPWTEEQKTSYISQIPTGSHSLRWTKLEQAELSNVESPVVTLSASILPVVVAITMADSENLLSPTVDADKQDPSVFSLSNITVHMHVCTSRLH